MTNEDAEGLAGLVRGRAGSTLPEGEPELEVEVTADTGLAEPADVVPAPEPQVTAEPEPAPEPQVTAEPEPAPEPQVTAEPEPLAEDQLGFAAEPGSEIIEPGSAIQVAGPPADGGFFDDLGPDVEIVESSDPRAVREHAVDLRLARLHLRTGALQFARAEFESLATVRALDRDAYLDLAETRWRGGDLAAAGDAVVEYLEGGGTDPLAYVIAAEASAAMGRLADARRLARRALDRLPVPLERVFAGQARSEVWPAATDAEIQPVSTLFAGPGPDAARGGRIGLSGPAEESFTHVRPLEPLLVSGQMDPWESLPGDAEAGVLAYEALPLGLDLESRPAVAAPVPAPARAAAAEPAADDADLGVVRAAIDAGDLDGAAAHLAVLLQSRPELAPSVLAAIAGATAAAPGMGPGTAEPQAPALEEPTTSAPDAEIRVEPEPISLDLEQALAPLSPELAAEPPTERFPPGAPAEISDAPDEPSFDEAIGGWPSPTRRHRPLPPIRRGAPPRPGYQRPRPDQ